MAKYQIHGIQKETATGDFRGIFFSTPDNTKITVSHADNKISVTIPDNSYMHLDNTDSGQYFNFNYCAYISLVYTKTDGTTVQLPSQSIIEEMERQAYATGEDPDDVNYLPSSDEFLEFKKHIVLFKIGSTAQQTNWTVYVPGTSNRILTFDCPDNVVSYDVYICGCSINTSTYATYIRKKYATTGYKEWFAVNASGDIVNEDGGGGNACNCAAEYHETTGINKNNKLWESNGVGNAITITDKGDNTVDITVPEFTVGAGNGISPPGSSTDYENNYVYIEFFDSSNKSLKVIRKNTFGTYKAIDIPEGAVKVQVWAKAISNYGADVTKNPYPTESSIKYYKAPSASNAVLYYGSNNKFSKDSSFNPSLNKSLTWEWSGFSPSTTNTQDVIKGFRLFLYKDPLLSSYTTGPTKYSYDSAHKLIVSSNTTLKGTSLPLLQNKPSNVTFDIIYKDSNGTATKITSGITSAQSDLTTTECIDIAIPSGKTTNGSGSFTIIPKEFGFEKNDYCICEVGAYSKNGTGAKLFSTWQVNNCKLKNSANVWVKTKNDGWKEGTVWIKTKSGGWKEADSIWIKTKTEGWKEPS